MRQPLAIAAGAAVAALGALILGEYEPAGYTPYVAGLLFGIAVGEAVRSVGRSTSVGMAAAAGVEAGLGLVWAAFIAMAVDEFGWSAVPGGAWAGAVLGTVAAAAWVKTSARSKSRDDSRPEPEPEPRT